MVSIGDFGTTELLFFAVVGLVGVFIVLKIVHHFYKAFITGVFFTTIPFGANYFGYSLATDATSIVTFMLLGISAYLTTHTIHIGLKITRTVYKPFGRFFKEKDVKRPKKLPRN